MPVDFVNAVVGAGFGEAVAQLSRAIEDVIVKNVMFKSRLQHLKSRIDLLKKSMKEIEKFDEILDRQKDATKKLTKQLTEAATLVIKYSKIRQWNVVNKYLKAGKIEDLENSISEFFQIDDFQMLKWRNQAEILVLLKKIDERLNSSGGIEGTCAVPYPPVDTVGMDVALWDLKEKFKDDVSVLLVTAPPGCGKTTLVKMFGHDLDIQEKFGRILFVTVTKTPDLKVIVQRLCDHIGRRADEFQSDDDAILQLEQLLTSIGTEPTLLILDDVWSESILEKFEFPIPNYKILVTSRCAFSRIQCKIHLELLNHEQAMELFRRLAKPQDKKRPIPEDLVNKIVKGCGRLPLALIVIGKSLCGKPLEVWRKTEKKWSNDHSILDSDDQRLLRCLESSLDILDDAIKKCFMDLGSFPEDQRISVAALIDMWVELYELDEDDVISKLDELTDYNLASLVLTRKVFSEADLYYNEDFVTQHDLLRELAIRQSSHEQSEKLIVDISGDNLPKWWKGHNEQSVNARLLSISTGKKFSSNWCNMQPLEVEVLVLNFQTKNYTLPEFVEKMGKLKVLIVTNNGFFPAELSNFQLLGFLHNLKKIRLENVSVPSLCKNAITLNSLEKISLVMCSIDQAFSNYTIQISDAVPNLEEINIEYCKDLVELPTGLCDIVTLKKLNITNCHKLSALPKEIENLENLQVLRLASCTNLLKLPESVKCLHELSFLDISDCISLSKLPEHIGKLCNLKELRMNGCSGLSYGLPPSTLDLEEMLELVICDEEGATLWDDIKDRFTNLRVEITENDINLNWLANMDFC